MEVTDTVYGHAQAHGDGGDGSHGLEMEVTDTIGWDIWEGATMRMLDIIAANPKMARGGNVIELGAGVSFFQGVGV